VNAIKLYFKSHTPVYIWFDLICFNEHQTEINSGRQGYNWFASTIKSGIESVGKTLLVMTNTTLSLANSPLRRTWCLFEVYCTIETKCSLEIITSSAEEVKLTKAIECDFTALNKELMAILFEKSVSSLKADGDAMYGVIERSIGFDGVNSMIMEQVRQWLLHFIQTLATSTAPISSTRKSSSSSSSAAADNATAETLHAAYVHALGDIQCSQGRYVEAEELFRTALHLRSMHLGDDHMDTLSSLHMLCVCLYHQNRLDEAEPNLVQCIMFKKIKLGKDDPSTIDSMCYLARVYKGQMRLDEAESMYKQVLKVRRNDSGKESNALTLSIMKSFAELNMKQGKFLQAEELYIDCVSRMRIELGYEHPDTLHALYGLADLYAVQGRNEDAESSFTQCIDLMKAKLGPDHPSLAVPMGKLAYLFEQLGQYEKAEGLYLQCLEIKRAKFGVCVCVCDNNFEWERSVCVRVFVRLLWFYVLAIPLCPACRRSCRPIQYAPYLSRVKNLFLRFSKQIK
jgi:tetratricopeptide (TPR) repeat protein